MKFKKSLIIIFSATSGDALKRLCGAENCLMPSSLLRPMQVRKSPFLAVRPDVSMSNATKLPGTSDGFRIGSGMGGT